MRHHNPKSTSYFSSRYNRNCYSPYTKPYSWTKASPECRYVQVLKYIMSHPKCKRYDIICGVWNFDKSKVSKKACAGYQSLLFSNMLYSDLIDYNNNYEYCVTEYGRKILRKAGITELTITTKVVI